MNSPSFQLGPVQFETVFAVFGKDVNLNIKLMAKTHLKNGNPGIAYVIKVDGTLKRVDIPSRAVGIVLIPIDTCGVICAVVGSHVQLTLQTLLMQPRYGVAVAHAIIPHLRADEWALVVNVVVIGQALGTGIRRNGISILNMQFNSTLTSYS